MYKLVIAEDEPIECQALALMIQNNCQNIKVIGQVNNGFDAIELCRLNAPDIVLADINMPGIDGLETIREIRKFAPQIKFVILSSYNRFEYAQQAIKLGVEDFILKPAKIAKLKQSFDAIIEKMESQSSIDTQNTALIDRMELIRPVVESDCIYAVITDDTPAELRRLFSFLGYSEYSGFCFLIDGDVKLRYLLHRIKEALTEVGTIVIGECFNDVFVFCVLYKELPNEKRTQEVGDFVTMLLKKNGKPQCKLGIGNLVENITQMNESYRQALVALDYVKNNKMKFLKYEEIADVEQTDVKNHLMLHAATIGRMLLNDKWEDCSVYLSRIMLEFSCVKDFSLIKELAYKFLILTEHEIERAMSAIKPYLDENTFNGIFNVENSKQLSVCLMDKLKVMEDIIRGFKAANTNAIVMHALEYIAENYCKNIMLDDIAAKLGISNFYLSKLVKKHTGKNFTDLIAEKRIEHAKTLLEQDLSIKEITYSVGFNSQNYFTKIFKKYVGITPSEYKNSSSNKKP